MNAMTTYEPVTRAPAATGTSALLGDGLRELTAEELALVSGGSGNWFSQLWSDTFHPISLSKADAAGIKGSGAAVRRLGDGSVGGHGYEAPTKTIGYVLGASYNILDQLW